MEETLTVTRWNCLGATSMLTAVQRWMILRVAPALDVSHGRTRDGEPRSMHLVDCKERRLDAFWSTARCVEGSRMA